MLSVLGSRKDAQGSGPARLGLATRGGHVPSELIQSAYGANYSQGAFCQRCCPCRSHKPKLHAGERCTVPRDGRDINRRRPRSLRQGSICWRQVFAIPALQLIASRAMLDCWEAMILTTGDSAALASVGCWPISEVVRCLGRSIVHCRADGGTKGSGLPSRLSSTYRHSSFLRSPGSPYAAPAEQRST